MASVKGHKRKSTYKTITNKRTGTKRSVIVKSSTVKSHRRK